MKLWKVAVSGLLTFSMLTGMNAFVLAEESQNPGISIETKEGTTNGVLKDSKSESTSRSSVDFNDMERNATGNDWFPEEDDNSTTIEEWNIKVPIPDNSTSMLDGSTGEFYIYPTGQEGIPYVMIMPFDYSYGGESFLNSFKDYMLGIYADLQVTEDIHEVSIGQYNCWQTRYEYTISDYQAQDRRVAIDHNGKIYMLAVKEIPELDLLTGTLLEDTVEGLVFLDQTSTPTTENPNNGGILNLGGNNAPDEKKNSSGDVSTAFTMTRIEDPDTGLAIARMYAPSDYSITQTLDSYGNANTVCSPACPWQVVLVADSPDYQTEMMYCSQMSYVYSQQMYQEGTLYYGISSMLEPMNASAYADRIVQMVYNNVGDIYIVDTKEATDEEQAYLQDRAQNIYDYYDSSFSTTDFISLDGTASTYIEKEYAFEYNGEAYSVIVITATDLVQYTQTMAGFTDTLVQMTVPYVYVYAAPSDEIDAGRANFDLFMSNTRVSDEFLILTQKVSMELEKAITSGTSPSIDNDEIADVLGTGDGTYDSEEFCDYILSQNSYTTSDGKVIKVPNSYDYVYEGENGNIYVSNSTDQPAGSTRLYAN
ncbi:MAG: hypothetical protein SO005_11215 [Candidatus Choladocola sp.]|nr:hypothetical protein [Candidatus Choladocola sp.]